MKSKITDYNSAVDALNRMEVYRLEKEQFPLNTAKHTIWVSVIVSLVSLSVSEYIGWHSRGLLWLLLMVVNLALGYNLGSSAFMLVNIYRTRRKIKRQIREENDPIESMFSMWKDKPVDIESIRKKAWPDPWAQQQMEQQKEQLPPKQIE